jgi:hypothetical protein
MARRFFYVCAGLLCFMLAYQLGVRSAGAQTGQLAEVATGMYDLNAGDPIPMPRYADGTPAQPSECSYSVAAYTAGFLFPSPYVVEGVHFGVVAPHSAPILEAYFWNEQQRPPFPATATITVLAVRVARPTQATRGSWGQVKARYR